MEAQLEELRAQIANLAGELNEVQRRLDGLEARNGAYATTFSAEAADQATPVDQPGIPELPSPAKVVALIGRTLIVLGGAYLLRAVSDAAVIPPFWGAAAALAYATWWLAQVRRAADAGQRLGAFFHGAAAMMIAFPLIWESTARFEFVPIPAAAGALVLFCAMGFAVSWRRDLWEIAWGVCLLTLVTTLSLFLGTHDFLAFTIVLLLIVALVELVAFQERWLGLRWPAALTLDLAMLLLLTSALRDGPAPEGYPVLSHSSVIAIGLAIPAIYFVSISARSLLRERPVTPFEMTQAVIALLVGCGGAVKLVSLSGEGGAPGIGLALLAVGAACYATAFSFIDRRSGRGRNFYCYTTFGGLMVLAGTYMTLDPIALACTWSALAITAAWLGKRFDRITLRLHGACYVAAAAAVGGLLGCAFDGLLAESADSWGTVTLLSIGLTGVAIGSFWILVTSKSDSASEWFELLPQLIVGGVAVWSVAGIAAGWLARPLAAVGGEVPDPALLAAGRTAIIAGTAVALAWAGRRWALLELTWLAYPVLVGGFAKLLWQDLSYGDPRALFLALAVYGAALIVTPRMLRRET